VAAVLLVAGASGLGALTLDDPGNAARHLGLFAVDAGGILMAVALGVVLTARELDGGPAAIVLTRPVARWQLLAGRWLGVVAVTTAGVAALGVAAALAIVLRGGHVGTALGTDLWLAIVQAALVAAIALPCATAARPLPAGVFALALAVIGRQVPVLRLVGRRAGGAGGRLVDALAAVLPNLQLYGPGAGRGGRYLVAVTAYGLGYAALMVLLAAAAVRRRDFV
jgi:hypothetical protein